MDRGTQHWWEYDLPRVHERVFRRYMARNRQFKQEGGSTRNPIPAPEAVSADMARWWNPKRDSWVTYNSQPQGLVTALERGWLPEAPAQAVVEPGETTGDDHSESGLPFEMLNDKTCDICRKGGFASPSGVKLHKTRMHKE